MNRPSLAVTTHTVLQAVLLGGIFLLNFFQPTDADTWWHLAAGRYMVEHGTLPPGDPFSYTVPGTPWVMNEWLGEVVVYLTYHLAGYAGAVAFFAALVALAFWFLLRSLRIMGIGVPLACVLTLWAAAISRIGWNVRPQVFSFLFIALFVYLLLRSRARSDRWLWVLPPVMVLWVNLHPSHVMGLMLLGLFGLGEILNRGWGMGDRGWKAILRSLSPIPHPPSPNTYHPTPITHYIAVGAATAAATLVNPYGIGALIHPVTYIGSRDFNLKFIAEWQSPNFHDYYFFIFGASLLLPMVLASKRPVDWALALPQVVLAVMSLQWVRTLPFYAAVFAPYLASRLVGEPPLPEAKRVAPRASRLNSLLLVACFAVMGTTLFVSDRVQLGREPSGEGFPVAGVEYIKRAGLTGNLFNTYHWGGYILWSFYPDRRVFVDGRTDMYGEKIVEEYREVVSLDPRWSDVLARHDVRVVLVEKGSALASLLRATGAWREDFTGPIESVFVKR